MHSAGAGGQARYHAIGDKPVAAPCGVVDWLGLAAAPTFAVMALVTLFRDDPLATLCSAAHGAVPLGGMVIMYILMSVFHLPPWVGFAARLRQRSIARIS